MTDQTPIGHNPLLCPYVGRLGSGVRVSPVTFSKKLPPGSVLQQQRLEGLTSYRLATLS